MKVTNLQDGWTYIDKPYGIGDHSVGFYQKRVGNKSHSSYSNNFVNVVAYPAIKEYPTMGYEVHVTVEKAIGDLVVSATMFGYKALDLRRMERDGRQLIKRLEGRK